MSVLSSRGKFTFKYTTFLVTVWTVLLLLQRQRTRNEVHGRPVHP